MRLCAIRSIPVSQFVTGFMRLRPGPKFWAPFYAVLCVAQLGLPALAAGSATTVFATFSGRMPLADDTGTLTLVTYGIIGAAFVLLLFGDTIERTLEYVSWTMVIYIFGFLTLVNIFFVPAGHWASTFGGFFSFGTLPSGIDLPLVGGSRRVGCLGRHGKPRNLELVP